MDARLHTYTEAAERLVVAISWLQHGVQRGEIPCTRVGRYVRFTEADLDAIVQAGRTPVAPGASSLGRRNRRTPGVTPPAPPMRT